MAPPTPAAIGARAGICVALCLACGHAHAADAGAGAGGLAQVLPGLAAVLALIVAVAWLAKKFGAGRAAGGSIVRFIAGQSVGSRERVVVVEIAGQWLVLGVAPGRVSAIAQMARPAGTGAAADAVTPGHKPFAQWLERALKK